MPRLLGVEIPAKKKSSYALRYIYGIGPDRADQIVAHIGIDPNLRATDLSEEQINKIMSFIAEKKWVVEGDLRREITSTSAASRRSTATEACVTAAACPCAASAPRPTPAPVRGRARPLVSPRKAE